MRKFRAPKVWRDAPPPVRIIAAAAAILVVLVTLLTVGLVFGILIWGASARR